MTHCIFTSIFVFNIYFCNDTIELRWNSLWCHIRNNIKNIFFTWDKHFLSFFAKFWSSTRRGFELMSRTMNISKIDIYLDMCDALTNCATETLQISVSLSIIYVWLAEFYFFNVKLSFNYLFIYFSYFDAVMTSWWHHGRSSSRPPMTSYHETQGQLWKP